MRGKAGKAVEFGAKISASNVNGFVFLDKKTKKELQKALKTEEHAVTRERILILLLMRNEGKKMMKYQNY